MKIISLLVFFLLISLNSLSYSQSIEDIFKELPLEYTPELTVSTKDSLLQSEIYTLVGPDSVETVEVAIGERSKNFIQLNYYFTTGQNGFIRIELRKFLKTNGGPLVVYAKYGGASQAFDQHTLQAFDYNNEKLTPNNEVRLPKVISTKDFLKEDLPDNVEAKKILMNTGYDLNPEEPDSVAYFVRPNSIGQEEEYLRTSVFIFTWNGKNFTKRNR